MLVPCPAAQRLTVAVAAILAFGLFAFPASAGQIAADALREGSTALAQNDLQTAAAAFERAIEDEPTSTEAWLKLGLTLSRGGDLTGAAEAYERVVALEPRHARALNNLGNLRFREDDFENAAGYYARALEIDPDYLIALYHQGRIQHQLGRADAAEELFLRCITATPASEREQGTQLDCRFYLGVLRFRTGDFAETADFMQTVLRVYPAHLEARYFLGMAWLRLGRTADGKEQLEIHRKMLDARRKDEPIAAPGDR